AGPEMPVPRAAGDWSVPYQFESLAAAARETGKPAPADGSGGRGSRLGSPASWAQARLARLANANAKATPLAYKDLIAHSLRSSIHRSRGAPSVARAAGWFMHSSVGGGLMPPVDGVRSAAPPRRG